MSNQQFLLIHNTKHAQNMQPLMYTDYESIYNDFKAFIRSCYFTFLVQTMDGSLDRMDLDGSMVVQGNCYDDHTLKRVFLALVLSYGCPCMGNGVF